MPILTPTHIEGLVMSTLVVADRDVSLESEARDGVRLTYAGIPGDAHGGLTRRSCSRVTSQYQRGTEIRNTRQLSILSAEELADIAETMKIPTLEPQWVGANLVISGLPRFTELPPGSRLIFTGGASVTVDMENGPCRFPGDVIEGYHPGKGRLFAKSATGRRGLTGWVEREGEVAPGDAVRLHVPPQRIYHLGEAREPVVAE